MAITLGITSSKKDTGHFSKASAKIVWLVKAVIERTISTASSNSIPRSPKRRIISGITKAGWVSLIWITA